MSIKSAINGDDSTASKCFAIGIQVLIVLSLISFSIETLPKLTPQTRQHLRSFETFTVAVFTAEYLLRIWAADKPLRFIFSFYGLVDLAAILPFYISTGLDLRAVRAFRLLRLVRILKLVRYSQAAQRFHRAFLISREELILFGCLSLILLYLSAVGIYYFERDAQPEAFGSVFHSLWWAVATLTTVGYGDAIPITSGGRIFTFFVLILGIGIVAIPTGLISSALSKARREETDEQNRDN